MGQPKQLLMYKGSSLLKRAIEAGVRSKCGPISVLLGANHEILVAEINKEPVDIIINPLWKEGMATSIKAGMEKLMETNLPDQVIFMLCDQPFADENILNALIMAQEESGKPIIACGYNGTVGVPVLFDQKFLPLLLKLKGKEGAKNLLFQFSREVTEIPFPFGHIDIDTISDYTALLSHPPNQLK